MRQKPPSGKRGRKVAGRKTTDPKTVSAASRLAEFPNHTFMVSKGRLFCKACKTEVTMIKSSIKKHITTSRHEDNMAKFKLRDVGDNEIKVFLSDYFRDNPDEAGGTNVSPEARPR